MIDDRLRHPLALRNASRRVLERAMRQGTAPAFESLQGWVFRGWNTLRVTRLVGIAKFGKAFYAGGPERAPGPTPFLQGYNVVVRQNANWDAHISKPNEDSPQRIGFYRVYAAPHRYPASLFIDYAKGANGLHPSFLLRDYLVQIWPDEPDILLGKAYVALGLWLPMSYFVLQRWKTSDYRGG